MRLRIFPQGYLDGSCLLYSIMNAYKTLISPEVTISRFYGTNNLELKWRRLVAMAPSIHQYLNGEGSDLFNIRRLDSHVADSLIRNAFVTFMGNRYVFNIQRLSLKQLRSKSDYLNTVVIMSLSDQQQTTCYQHFNHWVVVVGQTGDGLALACSYCLYTGTGYEEHQVSGGAGRFFNNYLPLTELSRSKISESFLFQVQRLER